MPIASAALLARAMPSPEWRDLPEMCLSDLARLAELRSFTQDAELNGSIFIVLDGLIGSVRGVLSDRRAVTALFLRGDLVDLSATPKDDRDGLLTFRPTRALAFATSDFNAAMQQHKELALTVCANLKRQSFNLREHAAELFTKAPDQRLAAFLLWLAQISAGDQAQPGFELPMRRYDLARYLGMQPETLSRKIKTLTAEGAISQSSPSHLVIESRSALEAMASGLRRVA